MRDMCPKKSTTHLETDPLKPHEGTTPLKSHKISRVPLGNLFLPVTLFQSGRNARGQARKKFTFHLPQKQFFLQYKLHLYISRWVCVQYCVCTWKKKYEESRGEKTYLKNEPSQAKFFSWEAMNYTSHEQSQAMASSWCLKDADSERVTWLQCAMKKNFAPFLKASFPIMGRGQHGL